MEAGATDEIVKCGLDHRWTLVVQVYQPLEEPHMNLLVSPHCFDTAILDRQ
jgi:hypothetical protein